MVAPDREGAADVDVVAVVDAAGVDVHHVPNLDRPPRRRRMGATPHVGPGRDHRADRRLLAAACRHLGVEVGGDLELGAPRPDVLAQRLDGGVDDLGGAPHALQLGLRLDQPHAVDDPVAVDDVRAGRGDRVCDRGRPAARPALRPALHTDRRRRPAALVKRGAQRVDRRRVVVEDGVVAVGPLHERAVALVVDEHEPLVLAAPRSLPPAPAAGTRSTRSRSGSRGSPGSSRTARRRSRRAISSRTRRARSRYSVSVNGRPSSTPSRVIGATAGCSQKRLGRSTLGVPACAMFAQAGGGWHHR